MRDGYGEPVTLSPAASQAFWHLHKMVYQADGCAQVEGLKRLARVSGIERLYVQAAGGKEPVEITRYLRGLGPEEYVLKGSGPVRLVVSFPRPRLSVVSRETQGEREGAWVKTLTELPVQRAVLRLASGAVGAIQVTEVRDAVAPAGFERFVSAAVAGSGQSAREVERTQAERREAVARIAGRPEAEKTEPAGQRQVALPKPRKIEQKPRPVPAAAREQQPAEPLASLVPIAEDGSLA